MHIRSYSALRFLTQPINQWYILLGPLVLELALLIFRILTVDRDRTVSRRSEPSSCTLLMGEQPNPWDLLQPQDRISRHRPSADYLIKHFYC